MTLEETEQGRMNLWDAVVKHALGIGKDVDQAIEWAEKAVKAFEAKFHSDKVG